MFRSGSSRPAVSLLVILLAAAFFSACGHFLAAALISHQQQGQMEELASLALRRSEAAIDHGAATLDELASKGVFDCAPASLQAVRLDVYRGGSIKDIRILSPAGSVICSAFSETLEFDVGAVTSSDMTPTDDGALLLHPMALFFGNALGIRREFADRGSLAAILGIGGPALDVLPANLRSHGEVALRMRDGRMISKFSGAGDDTLHGPVREIVLPSARYPVEAVVEIGQSALIPWKQDLYLPIVFGSAIMGLLFGVLLARPAFGPETPLAELDRALAAREFEPYFQPIFDIATGCIVGAEVLARWIREDGSVISPAGFIDLAEQSGRVRPLTWQVMEKALADAADLLRGHEDFYLSFNITPDHFMSAGFLGQLDRVVAHARARPGQIGVEITERQGFDDPAGAQDMVVRLQGLGFRLLIDDVGIGHSGLSQIQMLGADTIKIDKFFVDSISLDTSSNIVIEMLARLARNKGMTIIAEGIETEAQAAALAACGVTYGQGYLVARPMRWSDFHSALKEGALGARLGDLSVALRKAGIATA